LPGMACVSQTTVCTTLPSIPARVAFAQVMAYRNIVHESMLRKLLHVTFVIHRTRKAGINERARDVSSIRWGYGRVSTRDQHTEAQNDALAAAGVDPKHIRVEKASTRLVLRPELEKLRKLMREGDTLIITKVDRLARSLLDLISIADDLRAQGIRLEVLTGTFNRDDPMGEAFFQMTGVFAQLERDMIRVRTNEGLEAARARGRTGGRKAKLTDAQAAEVRRLYAAKEKTVKEIGELFGITRESVYRYVKAGRVGASDMAGWPRNAARPVPRVVGRAFLLPDSSK
jgi:DNA invertase Pin-like site-specific DNA recombinase